MKLDIIDNHRSRFVPVAPGWHQRKMQFAVKSYQTNKNEDENPTVLSLTKTGLKVKTDLAFGKSTDNYVGHQIVEPGQFVFTPRDFDATPILCGVADTPGCISNLYIVFDVSPEIDARFLEYYFWGLKHGYEFFAKLSFGMRYSFNRTQFENIPLLHPDLATQRQIADFLDRETARIDLLIEKKQRLVALLGERNNVARSERLIGLRDRHGERKLSHVCLIQRGRFNFRPRNAEELYDGEFPFLQTGDVARAKKFITEHKQTLSGLGASISKKFKKGTVLMAIAANVGDVAILEFDAFCPDSVVGFLPEKEVDTGFLYYVLKGAGAEIASSSTSNAQDNTNIARLGALKIPMPPKEEQVAVASEFARREEQEIKISEQTNASIDRLKEYRSALITAAVTGQIDVTTHAKSGTPDRRLDAIQEEMGA